MDKFENIQTSNGKQHYIPMEVTAETIKDFGINPVDVVWTRIGNKPRRVIMIPVTEEQYKAYIYDIDSVTMTIFQPRRDSVSTYTISKEELLKWADEVLSPTAQLAAKGEGEYKAGDHCQFCKVKATCRKRAEYNLELARYDFEMPSTLEDDEIEAILSKVDALVSWAGDIKEYTMNSWCVS